MYNLVLLTRNWSGFSETCFSIILQSIQISLWIDGFRSIAIGNYQDNKSSAVLLIVTSIEGRRGQQSSINDNKLCVMLRVML